jgi:ferredoxin
LQAYTVLSNEITRELYDIDLNESKFEEQLGFTNEALSEWLPVTEPLRARNADPAERRALFVDEVSCIGCKNCCWQARATFVLDSMHGRARAVRQWADAEDDLQAAVGTCESSD